MAKQGIVIDQIYTWLKFGCYQRSLHYHNTPLKYRSLYGRQLEYVKKRYEIFTPGQCLESVGSAQKAEHPSLIIGAFDGYRNNYDTLYPLLKEKELPAWFLLVTDFLDTPVTQQEEALQKYRMQWLSNEYKDGRYAMTWEEAAEISRKHTIINHTATHHYLTAKTGGEEISYEVLHSEKRIKEKLHQKPAGFSWLGGAWMDVNAKAGSLLSKQEYQFLLGYRLEFIGTSVGKEAAWEKAVSDYADDKTLSREVSYYEQVISNVGWYSAVPAILPCYVYGSLVTKNCVEDGKLAEHFASVVSFLMKEKGKQEKEAALLALEVLAVNQMGQDFPY